MGKNQQRPVEGVFTGHRPLEELGIQRTELYCHHCSKNFVAELDYAINGDHVVECPHCGHEHCRTIINGSITSERWDGRNGGSTIRVSNRSVWKSSVIQAKTSSVSQFLRDAWFNTGDRE